MKLVVVNGSPKKSASNTSMLLDSFLAGFEANRQNLVSVHSVKDLLKEEKLRAVFFQADYMMLAFPLYTNAMNAWVKRFIEMLGPIARNSQEPNPKLLFLVQSGFPEATHSRDVEKYLQKLCRRLNCDYEGTIIRGGIDFAQQAFPSFCRKGLIQLVKNGIRKIGKTFGETGRLDQKMLKRFSFPERLPWIAILFFHIYSFFGVRYYGFDAILKKNNVFEYKDATPYF